EYKKDWDNKILYTGAMDNKNEFCEGSEVSGIYMTSMGVPSCSAAWGTMALTTLTDKNITYRTSWADRTWGGSLLDFWDDFSDDGTLSNREAGAPFNQIGSLSVKKTIPPGETEEFLFVLTWHFPNRMIWFPEKEDPGREISNLGRNPKKNIVGNHYTTVYKDAWEAAEKTVNNLTSLEIDTVLFVDAFCSSDLPLSIREAALFNISTLRTQTCFRTVDGRFFGWEGIHDFHGSCFGSCTHVWNYEQATAFLFGELAVTMRDVEFLHAVDKTGHMNFRVQLPLEKNCTTWGIAAADGQMGCIMKMYREWHLSGDNEMMKSFWPAVKKTLEFCWVEGGWDADKDGVMEGCQHNTMDVEYYGPNPQMQGWYLGALRAAEEMAKGVGDIAFAEMCRELFRKGSRWMDENLFNGDYYEHIIKVPGKIHPGVTSSKGVNNLSNPVHQLGAGCLIDQLAGQYMAHVLGLGYLLKPENIRKTLKSIMKYNFKEEFHNHFNTMRSYVLNDESALLMASYPKGRRPKEPFPYYTEVMTGFEHSTAAHMFYEGLTEEGLRVIDAIRARYDGYKRNPFDEAECGHHYVRAMASWAEVLALTGFRYSAITKEITFSAREGNFFWSNGYSWGRCILKEKTGEWRIKLEVLYGTLSFNRFILSNAGSWESDSEISLKAGHSRELVIYVLQVPPAVR
ncbi:MAG: hypothetical protein KAQ69_12930, partial [Spirochaetales bacterium]|nr:hypothetical protein [Spirochaetales bacterium]